MYIDYCLKFDSEAEAKAVLYRIEGAVEADPENGVEAQEGYEVANYQFVDVIGTIYKPTGKMLQSDEGEVPEMAPLDGYHVNVRVLGEAAELEAYRVHPVTPVRVWA
jgi:hypothetical protein